MLNKQAEDFLAAYAQGEVAGAGWLFAKALQQSRLDFSDGSLERVDYLIASVRERAKPSSAQLRESEQGRNFCALLAFYLGECIHRSTGASLDWQDRATAVALLAAPDLPEAPHMRLVAVVPEMGKALMLLGWVESSLLGEGEGGQPTAREIVQRFVERIKEGGPLPWALALYGAGQVAALQMQIAYEGETPPPTVLSSQRPATLMRPVPGSDDAEAFLKQSVQALEVNPGDSSWRVLSFAGEHAVQGKSFPAVIVWLQVYGGAPFTIKLAFPYRPTAGHLLFAHFHAHLQEASVPADEVQRMMGSLESGTRYVRWPGNLGWEKLRAPVPMATLKHQLKRQDAQPEMGEILSRLRASFEQRQQRMSDISLASVLARLPLWLKDRPDDTLQEVYAKQRLLLSEGRLVWGALVQANSQMFAPGDVDCPGLLVYSQDRHFDDHPAELRAVGRAIFALKGQRLEDPELDELAVLVTEEVDRQLRFTVPRVFCTQEVCSGIFMLCRQHLPAGVMNGSLFPALTHPATEAVLMLPFEFWPMDLIVMWKKGRL